MKLSLSKLLAKDDFPKAGKKDGDALEKLQLQMLRIQQGIWHRKRRAVIVFEGCDAAGKGGAIRRLTENLDPRGVQVYGIGPPSAEEQGRHYLYRFWEKLPAPGCISVFDRSWYGRVLVERVKKLAPKERWQAAYREINEFEAMLADDGVDVIKFFLAISKGEQLVRFEERLSDPYKHWKLTEDDVEARKQWDAYVKATDAMFAETNTKKCPWFLVAANDKHYARKEVLASVTERLCHHEKWLEGRAQEKHVRSLKEALHKLGVKKL